MSHHLYVLDNQCFKRIPIFHENKLQFVDQVTRNTFPWSIKEPCKSDNFDQVSPDADADESYRLTPYPIKAPDKVENRFIHADFTAQQLGIYSQHDWTKTIDKMKFNQLVDDAAEKFDVAQAVNFAISENKNNSQLQSEYNNYFI